MVDNLSPFTPDILDCLARLKVEYSYKRFSEVSDGDLAASGRVILSGRRKNSKEVNAANSAIVRHCHRAGKPMLGICYGAEIIALTLGGSIRRMQAHVQGTTPVSISAANPLAQDRQSISVYESHAYCVARLPDGFQSLASSQYCEHEMFSNDSKKIYGTQFHPEKSGADGMMVLHNFTKL